MHLIRLSFSWIFLHISSYLGDLWSFLRAWRTNTQTLYGIICKRRLRKKIWQNMFYDRNFHNLRFMQNENANRSDVARLSLSFFSVTDQIMTCCKAEKDSCWHVNLYSKQFFKISVSRFFCAVQNKSCFYLTISWAWNHPTKIKFLE